VGRPILAAAGFSRLAAQFYENFLPSNAPLWVMVHYERRLPHFDVVEQPLFVTFRLHGSLPGNRIFPPQQVTSGKSFVTMDRLLDQAAAGPRFLQQPEIAQIVADALCSGEYQFKRYELHSFVIMPNHVHILITPHVVATRWLGPLKGVTAYHANRSLGRTGQPFWQEESYDHLVRSPVEMARIRSYIEQNPVSAGLVTAAEQFPWSSAYTTSAAPSGAANSGRSRL
jgi:REP element-mobilizing transposase RayT